ncbi:MFS transporter [Fodinicola acaciae]|uniref:MFS transporter n=1 Tax=Fodinicola acaciae TaxID=2681555 RepID=UPI0013D271AC|nr:MFS transporter [Fodinicola acaciae]
MVDAATRPTVRHGFGFLWTAQAISDIGSQVGALALPLVGVVVLHTTTFQTSLITACAALGTAIFALPAGAWVDRRAKRPVMIAADLVRLVLVASVPAAWLFGVLTVAQLCVVTAVNTLLEVVFASASQAFLKKVVGKDDLLQANGKLHGTLWLANLLGPAIGGVVVGLVGAALTVLVDAASFLCSAFILLLVRKVDDSARPARSSGGVKEGVAFLARHRSLRRLLASYALMSWTIVLLSPIQTLFLIRELRVTSAQYGLAVAIPCVGGLVGAFFARRIAERLGMLSTMRWSGLLRGPWVLLVPLAWPGWSGLAVAIAGWCGLLTAASIYNATQTTYRQLHTPDRLMGRVTASWSMVVRCGQPVAALAGGGLATVIGLRPTLVVGAIILSAAGLLLPTKD